ncbi:MAG TPA: DUF2071 domain-containing protein [Actinomycetota bacterium]|nr:DUF2071 domain-containing protein [Actinomycetota bacterium]
MGSHVLPAFSVDVENFALVNYLVPAERVLEHLPTNYDLQTFDGDCFVTATCFCNGAFRPWMLPGPRLTFDESTFRTYVTHKGRVGVYFFGRYLSRPSATLPQRAIARDTYDADFTVASELTEDGYRAYSCHATSDAGEASFALTATERPSAREPFAAGDEMAQFLTYRLHGFFTTSLGFQGHMPVAHPRMHPWAGELSTARLDLFEQLGILVPDEAQRPHSVLVEPGVRFTLYAPRPLV